MAEYKVVKNFRDKYSKKLHYAGESFESSSEDRLKFLSDEGYIAEEKPEKVESKKGKK